MRQKAADDLSANAGLNFDPRDLGRMVSTLAPKLCETLEAILQAPPSSPSIDVLNVLCDGTGTPMRWEELSGRKGKLEDGSTRTREAKLGCFFITPANMQGCWLPPFTTKTLTKLPSCAPAGVTK